MSSAGSASGSGFSRSANALLVALVVLAVTCTGLIIWRRHAPGWRPVFDGEWRGGTGTNTAEIQQSA